MNGMAELARAIVGDTRKARSSEHLATVLRKGADGTYWVHIPGGADQTPITATMTEANEGDTVRVTISGGRAVMTGNVTSPSANVRTVTKVGGIANMALTTAYSESARIDRLVATSLTADSAIINDLQANSAYIDELKADEIYAEDIIADHMAVNNLYVDEEAVNNLNAKYAHITDGVIDNAKINYADVDDLDANYAHISDGMIDNAYINYAYIDGLRSAYAEVDLANIDDARIMENWVDRLMVQTKLIAKDGSVFTLDALQVNAENITAGTIDVQRLVITDPVTGKQSFLTWDPNAEVVDPDTQQTSYGALVQTYLDGSAMAENSIAADRIIAGSITTRELTAENIGGTNGWVNFDRGEFKFVNVAETEGISFEDGTLTIWGDAINMFAKASDLDAVESELNGENGLVGKVNDLQAHVKIESRGGNPVIVLDASGGQQNTGLSAELSNSALQFLENGNMVAEISNNELVITDAAIRKASVSEELSLGSFSWIPMDDGALALKWIGA